jgi:hypothetical protein
MFRPAYRIKIGTWILVTCCSWLAIVELAGAQQPGVDGKPLAVFGIGADDHTSRDLPKWIPQMEAIGIRNDRACRTLWSDVEPEEGEWNWRQLDEQLSYLADHHMECWGLLYGGVKWNTKDAAGGFPSHNLDAWSKYVFETVKHGKGRIRYWEVWNEPPNGTNDAPPNEYGRLMAATYEAVKAADPASQVGMAAQSVNLNYLEQALKGGAKDHFDYITLHPYETLGSVTDHWGTESVYMHTVPTVRKMLGSQDPLRQNVPVWFTEMGYDAGKDPKLQAQALLKAYTMGIAEGVSVMNWFEGIDGDSGPMGLLDEKGHPRPSYTAMAQMIKYLGNNPDYVGWANLNKRDYAFFFLFSGKLVMVAWAPGGTTDSLVFARPVQIIDPLTAQLSSARSCSLSSSPIIVEDVPANLVSLAKRNMHRAFPWDGDYTGARTVYVSMDGPIVAKGLHPQQGDGVQAEVVAYGGGARSGNVAGGPVFIVDPNFLSYTSSPIQITAVVRRTPQNHPAKLILEYESTAGFKKLPAVDIPDDKTWYVARWKIDDEQFVSKWVFNFRFDLGDYLIKEVSVTRLDARESTPK